MKNESKKSASSENNKQLDFVNETFKHSKVGADDAAIFSNANSDSRLQKSLNADKGIILNSKAAGKFTQSFLKAMGLHCF